MISSWPGQGDGEWWWLKRNWDKRERKDFDRDSCWWTTEGDWSHHSSGVALHIPRKIAYSSQYCIFVAILHIPRNIAYSLHNLRDETYPISVLFGGSFSGNSCPFSSKWVEFQISFNTFNDRILVVLKQPSAFFKIINFELFEDEVWRRFNFWRLCQRVWYEVYLWINSLDIFWTCMSLSKGLVRVPSLEALWALSSARSLEGTGIVGADLTVTTSLAARSSLSLSSVLSSSLYRQCQNTTSLDTRSSSSSFYEQPLLQFI